MTGTLITEISTVGLVFLAGVALGYGCGLGTMWRVLRPRGKR